MAWKNAWVEIDLHTFTWTQISDFFNIEPGTPEFDALNRRRQLLILVVRQANPRLERQGVRMWPDPAQPKRWLLYVHFPQSLADELKDMGDAFSEYIRYRVGGLAALPLAAHMQYWGEKVVLDPSAPDYVYEKNYPYFNVFFGVNP